MHFHHETQQTQTILKHSICAKEKERVEIETFGKQSPVPLGRPIQTFIRWDLPESGSYNLVKAEP